MGKIEQTIFDIAIDPRLKNIYPSWKNVLSFLVEQETNLLSPLIDFAYREQNTELFSLISFADTNSLTIKQKDKIFKSITNYHILHKRWFWDELGKLLSRYFVPEIHNHFFHELIKSEFSFQQYFTRTHIVEILRHVFEDKQLTEKQINEWKIILYSFLGIDFDYGAVLTRSTIYALSNISTITIDEFDIRKEQLSQKPITGVYSAIMNFYAKIDPNHPKSITTFFGGLAPSNYISLIPFDSISSKQGFIHFFNTITELEKRESDRFLDKSHRIFEDLVIKNIRSVLDDELKEVIAKCILSVGRQYFFSVKTDIQPLIDLLNKETPNLGTYFTTLIIKNEIEEDMSHSYGDLLASIVTIEEIGVIKNLLKDKPNGNDLVYWTILQSRDDKVQKLFSKWYPDQVKRQQKNREISNKNTTQLEKKHQQRIQEQYSWLGTCLDEKKLHAIHLFKNATEKVRDCITTKQKEQIKQIIVEYLQAYDPFNSNTVVTLKENNQRTITRDWKLIYFTDAVSLIKELEIDVVPHKDTLLESMFFVWGSQDVENILGLFPNINDRDIQRIVKKYIAKRDDDLHQESISRFINLCRKLKFSIHAKTFLSEIIKNPKMPDYTRTQAVDILSEVIYDEAYFLSLFNHFDTPKPDDTIFSILEKINEVLLSKNNEDAFNWRMDYIFNSKYENITKDKPGITVRRVGSSEGVGRILAKVTHEKFIPKMLALLEQSFKLVQENENYHDFVSNEIWNAVINFFMLQTGNKESLQSYLDALTLLTQKYDTNTSIHWFHHRIEKVKQEYMQFLSTSKSFGDAMKEYEALRKKQYLDISHPQELFSLLNNIINDEFRTWVAQGFYKFVGQVKALEGKNVARETLIQKHFTDKLENFLLRRELRASDIFQVQPQLYREAQILDDKRVDLIVSYGAIGSTMIEIKRVGNADLAYGNIEEYKHEKFLPYMIQTGCDHGIFLIFLDQEKHKNRFAPVLKQLEKTYQEYPNISIIGIDCIK